MDIMMFISLSTIRGKKKLSDGISEFIPQEYNKYINFDLIKMLINKLYKNILNKKININFFLLIFIIIKNYIYI